HEQVADEQHPQPPREAWRNSYCPWLRHMPSAPSLSSGVPVDGYAVDAVAPERACFARKRLCGLAEGQKLPDMASLPFNAAVCPAHSRGAFTTVLNHAANHGIIRQPPGVQPSSGL